MTVVNTKKKFESEFSVDGDGQLKCNLYPKGYKWPPANGELKEFQVNATKIDGKGEGIEEKALQDLLKVQEDEAKALQNSPKDEPVIANNP